MRPDLYNHKILAPEVAQASFPVSIQMQVTLWAASLSILVYPKKNALTV